METADAHLTSATHDNDIVDNAAANAAAGAFTPESLKMPDWKKELLLKRKSRTTDNGASAAAPAGSMSPSADADGADNMEGE